MPLLTAGQDSQDSQDSHDCQEPGPPVSVRSLSDGKYFWNGTVRILSIL